MIGFFAQLNGSVKSRFKASDINWIFFQPLNDKICHSSSKSENTTYLGSLVFFELQ